MTDRERAMLAKGNIDPDMRLDNFEALPGKRNALRAVLRWMPSFDKKRPGLVLFGPSSRGKTHLANGAAYKCVVDLGLFALVLPTYRIPRHDTDAVLALADWDEVPVLVLDDVGAEKRTERSLECLYLVVDARLRARAPMIVTTNFDPEELERWLGEEYGPRLMGRLREACVFVAVEGEDMRPKL